MSLSRIRDAERRLAQLEPEEPPEGLLALLKADIPAELPVHPDLKARTPAPEVRAAGWLGRNSWLAAALLVTTLGGGWLALQMWGRSPKPGMEAVQAPAAQAERGVEERRAKERSDGSAPGASSADEVGREQEADAEAQAPLAEPAPASPSSPRSPRSPRILRPAEPPASAIEQEKLAAGVEGGVVGGVAGGVAGGVPGGVVGGVPGGVAAPVQVPEDFAEFESAEQAAPRLRAREEAKSEARPAPPPPAAAPAPQAAYDTRDDAPLRVGGALERKRDRQENAAGGRAAAGWIERFDLRRPLAADGSGGEVEVSALPSPLVPGTFWLRVEVRARQGRGADLVLTPVGGAVGLRALGREAGSSSREGLAAGPVPGGARRLALFVAEPRGGKPSVKVSLRYRGAGGEGKDVAEASETVGLVHLGQSPARLADASPEDQLLVLAAELARGRETPVRRQLFEIARLAEGLAAAHGGTLGARAAELAGQARREAALAPR